MDATAAPPTSALSRTPTCRCCASAASRRRSSGSSSRATSRDHPPVQRAGGGRGGRRRARSAPTTCSPPTYRGHGHALANGVELGGLAAELMGRATGTCGGRSGSMNVIDREHRLLGCFGIVGGTISTATGAAFALQGQGPRRRRVLRRRAPPTRRYFAECLNFARGLQAAGRVRLREQPLRRVHAVGGGDRRRGHLRAGRACSASRRERIDGNDVLRCARRGGARRSSAPAAAAGPTLLECMTYRFVGHSRSRPGAVPQAGRARAVAGARPAEAHARGAGRRAGVAPSELAALEERGASRRSTAPSRPRSPPRSRSPTEAAHA